MIRSGRRWDVSPRIIDGFPAWLMVCNCQLIRRFTSVSHYRFARLIRGNTSSNHFVVSPVENDMRQSLHGICFLNLINPHRPYVATVQ